MKASMPVIGLALALITSPVLAWDEPDSFRGVPWGTTQSETRAILQKARDAVLQGPQDAVEARLTKTWGTNPDCPVKETCVMRAMVGPVPATLGFAFHDDRLVAGSVSFPTIRYDEMLALFIERYGRPTARRDAAVKNKMGATFTNEISEWKGEKISILLQKYGSTLMQGSAAITPNSELERRAREQGEAIKKGKGDL